MGEGQDQRVFLNGDVPRELVGGGRGDLSWDVAGPVGEGGGPHNWTGDSCV